MAGHPSEAGEPDVDLGRRLMTIMDKKNAADGIISYILLYNMLLSGGKETAQCQGAIITLLTAHPGSPLHHQDTCPLHKELIKMTANDLFLC